MLYFVELYCVVLGCVGIEYEGVSTIRCSDQVRRLKKECAIRDVKSVRVECGTAQYNK